MNVRGRAAAAVALAVLAGGACTSGDGGGDGGASGSPVADTGAAGATGDTEVVDRTPPGPTSIESPPPATDPTGPLATETSPTTIDGATTTIGTVPDDGVPGIDSGDAFCRSWSQFAGSFQALALATSFGVDPDAAPRLEVVAAPALVAAVGGLDEHLPAELEPERTAFVTDLAGPMYRRADRARGELVAAGLTDDEIGALGAAWLAVLAEAGLDDPDIEVAVPDGVDRNAYESAVAAFAAALPPINQDPSLITDAQTPLTDQYLADNCPDQGTLAGNDVIDQF